VHQGRRCIPAEASVGKNASSLRILLTDREASAYVEPRRVHLALVLLH